MPDIAMCENKECERSHECFRFTAKPSKYMQTYMTDAKEICEDRNYKFWIPNFKGEQHNE